MPQMWKLLCLTCQTKQFLNSSPRRETEYQQLQTSPSSVRDGPEVVSDYHIQDTLAADMLSIALYNFVENDKKKTNHP